MGRMKDLFIEEMNKNPHAYQPDADWEYEQQQYNSLEVKSSEVSYEPEPLEVRADGKKLYLIKDYKIWAPSYKDALELLPLIENF